MAKTRPTIRLRIDLIADCAIGPGKIGLLEAIDRTGSLSAAARELAMSYRRAWLLLHSINDCFPEASVELSTGEKDGGGTRVTHFGHELIRAYRHCEAKAGSYAASAFADFQLRPPTATTGRGRTDQADKAKERVSPPRRPISRNRSAADS